MVNASPSPPLSLLHPSGPLRQYGRLDHSSQIFCPNTNLSRTFLPFVMWCLVLPILMGLPCPTASWTGPWLALANGMNVHGRDDGTWVPKSAQVSLAPMACRLLVWTPDWRYVEQLQTQPRVQQEPAMLNHNRPPQSCDHEINICCQTSHCIAEAFSNWQKLTDTHRNIHSWKPMST